MNFPVWIKNQVATRRPGVLPPATWVGFAALVFYVRHLPSTVQALDTGELVLAAWGRFIAHPPGYPFFMWLSRLFIFLLPQGTVFWRASSMSAVLAAAVLATIYQSAKCYRLALCTIIVPLALHPIFWRYALLPDVFMLNAALLVVLVVITRGTPANPRRLYCAAAVCGLALGNHPTLIFAAPTLACYAWGLRCTKRASVLTCAALLCALICALTYASLLLHHTSALASWGQLQSIGDVVRHALRVDYGSFHLSARDVPNPGFQHSTQCLRQITNLGPWVSIIVLLAPMLVWPYRRTPAARGILALWGGLIAYIFCFLPFTNTDHPGVLERFYLLPLVWSCVIAACLMDAARMMPLAKRRPRTTCIAACVASMGLPMLHYEKYHQALDLSHETIVEDYAINLLESLPQKRATILVVYGDTRLHAVRYVQHVLGIRRDVVLLNHTALVPNTRDKMLQQYPLLHFPDSQPQDDRHGYVRAIYDLNHRSFDIIVVDSAGVNVDDMRTFFTGLARRLEAGTGTLIDWTQVRKMRRRSDTSRLTYPTIFQEELNLYAGYAYPYLAAALLAEHEADAQDFLLSALALVPYCLPAHYELCRRDPSTNESVCQDRMQKLSALWGDYF